MFKYSHAVSESKKRHYKGESNEGIWRIFFDGFNGEHKVGLLIVRIQTESLLPGASEPSEGN